MSKRKAPAVQIYIGDFLNGTRFMSNAQVGLYMRLLLEQADNGAVSQDVIDNLHINGKDSAGLWETIQQKFIKGEDGQYRNAKMQNVIEERERFRLKQSDKGKKSAERRFNHGSTTVQPDGQPKVNSGSTTVEPLEDEVEDSTLKKERASEPKVIPMPFTSEAFALAWAEWETSRREAGKTIKPTGRKLQMAKCLEIGEDRAIAMLKHSATNGYTGLYEPNNRINHGPVTTTQSERDAELARIVGERYAG